MENNNLQPNDPIITDKNGSVVDLDESWDVFDIQDKVKEEINSDKKNSVQYDLDSSAIFRQRRINRFVAQQARTLDKKHRFLIAYQKTVGSVWKSCQMADIKSRKTFYNWCKTDPDFKEAVDATLRVQLDYVEDALMAKIAKNHGPTIRWILSRKHPDYKNNRRFNPPQ